ncbi:MAG TPA: Ig-like domain-containing protein [Thermoanaerobaculia bacterium]|nr:Ig-like domain-containing protein [Thermoanaerobaculia bacterium]
MLRSRCRPAALARIAALLLCCASLASGGVLYREDFEDREPGRPPPLWEEEGGDEAIPRLIVVAEPDAENRAWGFAPRVRERPIDRPGESDPGARAILAELSFPLDAVEIGGRMRAGPRSAAAILLLDPADPARAIAAFHLETGSVRADRGETAALSTGGWIRFAIAADGPLDLAASFWPEGGPRPPAPQFRSPRPPAGTFRLGVLASGPSVLFDDLVVTVADPEGEPPSGESDPPRIAIFESGAPLADGSLWGREIRPTIVVEDESGFVVATTLDGAPFESGSPVGAEGPHVLRVEAEDAHGNRALALVRFTLDRSPPALALAEPAGAICTGAGSIELRGTASDPHLERVDLASPAGEIAALVDSAAGTWSATLPLPAAGAFTLLIRASDVLGHRAIHPLPIRVDRSAPAIAITAGGAPAIDGMIAAHPLSFLVAVRDDDPAVALELLLDGELYENASLVEREGSSLLVAAAVDCAGNRAEKRIGFTIDVTAPELGPFDPPIDSLVGSAPASIRGSVSDDAISVSIAGTPLAAVVAQGAFDLPGAPFDEGLNRHRLRAVDRAGNTAEIEYRLTLRTRPPSIDILERGVPLENGSLFNREVRPEIVTDDPEAEVEATLDGNAFTSGSVVSGEGTHLVRARASDALGHAATAEASFTIDRTPPAVAIISPLPGIVTARAIEVRGTATGAVAVSVNGVPAALAGPEFTATVAIDEGENRIVALARDEARNVGRAEVLVTLEPASGGIVLTFPADGAVTNRASTRVSGRVLSPSTTESVAIGSTPVVFDPAGSFTLDALPLAEGPNPITATARATTGRTSSASVTLIADRSPPRLRILESGVPLADQARLPAAAQLAIELSDDGGIASSATTIDGVAVVMPVTVAAPGGHTILAVAVDTAGNETRLERTFFVGGTAGGCRLEGFHPAAGSVIAAGTTLLTGRTGGAAGVTVDGVAATVSNGSFCATVGLPREGENEIKISCTDPEGNPFGVPATLALVRATQLPSVAIEEPPEGSVVTAETTRLAGVAGAGVVAVTVNGVEAAIAAGDPNAARSFAVDGVRLTPGLNVLLARARTASGKQALASRRVVHLPDAPSLSVTSPSAGAVVGNATAPVSGTWRGIDPSTLAIAGSAAAPIVSRLGDGEGSFLFPSVALAPGSNVVAVGGRDDAGREASAVLTLVRDDAAPFIAIEEPRDHAIFGADAAGGVAVHGTALAAPGATIEIGGAPAMIDAAESLTPSKSAYSFSGTIPLAALGPTAVVARVTEPSGAGAVHAIAARRLADPPSVLETFPEPFAASVDPGAMIVVLFSSPMDRVALAGAFRLESAAGSPVSGTLRIERDALTFAPAAPLGEGGEYTIAIAAAATDVAGVPLPAPYASSFRVTGTAPAGAPSLDPFPLKFCGPTLVVSGSARPGARVRLEVGALSLAAPADGAGAFRFELPLSGPSGHHLVRVAEIGGDGTLSPAASACVMIDCGGLRVDSASFDRSINRLTIALSEPADPASVTTGAGGSIVIRLGDGRIVGGTASLIAPDAIHVDPAEDLTRRSFALEVTAALRSAAGTALALPFTQEFPFDDEAPPPGDGSGFVSGEIYDAGTGRPLAGATIAIASPLHAFGAVEAMQSMQLSMQLSMQQSMQHEVETTATAAVTDARGRYTLRLAEGAHVLEVRGEGTTTAWRQIIVPSGGGVTPIDIRLAKLGATATADGSAMLLGDGGDAVATNASLEIPAGGVAAGSKVTLTSVGAQSLAGLLPPGWSPLGSAEIALEPAGTLTATLSFEVHADEIAAAAQTLSLARYDSGRDEWRVAIPVVSIEGGRAIAPISAPGAWALVHPDRAPLAEPPPPTAGSILAGAPDGCAPDPCPPLTALGFTLDPAVVLPSGSSVATLTIDGAIPFPSGTAVQAWIAEELQLADGSTLLDAPFATDLLLHRDLSGDPARAIFRIAPSPRAAEVLLQVGWERLRVLPYPGRLARGTLVGPEGGRIPSDAEVVVEIAAGATNETIRAAASSLGPGDLAAFHVPGFRVLGGLALELERASDAPAPDLDGDGVPDHAGIELLEPARVTFHAGSSALPRAGAQVIVAEVLEATPFGRVVRLAARAVDVTPEGSAALLFTTDRIDRAILPLDGVVREGTYLFLAATTPIAFATGRVRRGAGAPLLAGALVTAAEIGVADLTRASALFAIPVPAAPAAPFALIARHPLFGEGEPHRAGSAPAEGSVVVIGELILAPQPPRIVATTPASGAAGVPLTTTIGVRFDRALDPSSITADSIVVSSAPTDARVEGAAAADGAAALVWSLSPESSLAAGRRYEVAVAGSIRASSGAPLGQPFAFSFTTLEALESGEVRPERISITIPAEGMSTIRGTAGALPSGWQALAVRRGIDFAVRHQATAVADGSFAFAAGGCGATGAGGGRVGGSGAGDGVASAGGGRVGGAGGGRGLRRRHLHRRPHRSSRPRSRRGASRHRPPHSLHQRRRARLLLHTGESDPLHHHRRPHHHRSSIRLRYAHPRHRRPRTENRPRHRPPPRRGARLVRLRPPRPRLRRFPLHRPRPHRPRDPRGRCRSG